MVGRDLVKAATPLSRMGTRVQEHGRIRFGIKVPAKNRRGEAIERPKALKTWRFTSADREAIASLAEMYGGTVEPWSDSKANPQDQWQVITTTPTIRALLPPDSLSTWYELWSGAGCERRCDGDECQVATKRQDDPYAEVPCLCNQNGHMECKPKTRLSVLLPEIRMAGLWRLETQSWNAAEELPAMERMLQLIQTYGVLEIQLVLREQSTENGTKKFVVPKIEFNESTTHLIEGLATVVGLPSGSAQRGLDGPVRAFGELPASTHDDWETDALTATKPEDVTTYPDPTERDDAVIDVDPIDDDPPPASTAPATGQARTAMYAKIGTVAKARGVDKDDLRRAIVHTMSGGTLTSSRDLSAEQVSRAIERLDQVLAGEKELVLNGLNVTMKDVAR